MVKRKKGLSVVIATVLLVLVSVAAVALIAGIIIPMIKESLAKGKSCFELIDYLKIVESNFTCSNSSETRLMVERGMEEFEIKGFVVSIQSGGEAERFDIIRGIVDGVEMWNKTAFIDNIEIPDKGEARSYRFNVRNGNKVKIAVLQTNNRVCEADFYDIPGC